MAKDPDDWSSFDRTVAEKFDEYFWPEIRLRLIIFAGMIGIFLVVIIVGLILS